MSKTKDELMLEIADLQAEVAELREELARRNAALSASAEDGWIITAPNKLYTGVTAGVEFRNGKAFVPSSTKNAVHLVANLVDDFGYTAEPATAAELKQQPEDKRKTSTLEDLMRQPAVVSYAGK